MDRASSVWQRRAAVRILLTGLLLGAIAVAALTLGQDHLWFVVLTAAVLALLLGCVFVFPQWITPPRSAEPSPKSVTR